MDMTPHSYRLVLADLERRRAQLDAAIAAIRPLAEVAGPGPGETMTTGPETSAPPPETIRARRESKRKERETVRPTHAPSGDRHDQVLAALRAGAGTPLEISATTKLPRYLVFPVLKQLLASGRVAKSGEMRAVRYQAV